MHVIQNEFAFHLLHACVSIFQSTANYVEQCQVKTLNMICKFIFKHFERAKYLQNDPNH